MKISKAQKQKNRKKIIDATVELVIAKGFKSATMREIARTAGLGDATIYNYFPTKEAIIYGYYEDRIDIAVDRLKAVEGFNTYTFQEQLQSFFETMLDIFVSDREFLDITFKMTFVALSQHYSRIRPIKDKFTAVIDDIFSNAVKAGEIPDQVFKELTLQMFWEYYIGMVLYWLKDDSNHFESTSILIDKSLDLSCSALKAGIGNKIFDIGIFLFKNHVLSRMDRVKDHVDVLHGIKNKFMEKTK